VSQVVGCIVEHEGKVLLCKRAIEPCRGKWTVPAGYLELDESTAGGLTISIWFTNCCCEWTVELKVVFCARLMRFLELDESTPRASP